MSKKFVSQDGTFVTAEEPNLFVTRWNEIKVHSTDINTQSPALGTYSSKDKANEALRKAIEDESELYHFPAE